MQNAPERMNDTGTCTKIDTRLTQAGSRPVRYELIDKDGRAVAQSSEAHELGIIAESIFPDQSQDPDRSGKGWDVQVCGAGR